MALTILLIAALTGGLTAPTGTAVDKIDLMAGINTWEVVDERHLVLSVGPTHRYLVTLSHSCHTLPYATHLGVSASNNTVYAGFDYITADGERCAINTINELSNKQQQAMTRL